MISHFMPSAQRLLQAMSLTTLLAVSQSYGAAASSPDLMDMSLEELMDVEVVYAASKYEQTLSDAPSSVTIVTRKEIREFGYRTVAEILSNIRGLYATYDRNYDYIGVRGFGRPGDYNSRILLLVNGHRLNDNVFNSAFVGTDLAIGVDLIERVEVVRGPSSSIYGSGAFFAVVNIITRKGSELDGVEAQVYAGSYSSQEGALRYGKRYSDSMELMVSASIHETDGHNVQSEAFSEPGGSNGVFEDGDQDEFESFYGQFSIGEFTLQAAYRDREKGIPTAPWETVFNDNRTATWDKTMFLELLYEHTYNRGLNLTTRASWDRYDSDGDYVYDYSEDDEPYLVVNKDWVKGEWWRGEVTLDQPLGEHNRLLYGADVRYNSAQDQRNYDEEVYLDSHVTSTEWALYIQDEHRFGDKVTLTAGVRHDHYDTFGGTTNPRFALVYKPWDHTVLKFLYGEAFRAPSAFEFYYDDDFETQKSNPDLRPEEIRTYEVVFERTLGPQVRVVSSLFHYRIDHLINLVTDPDDDLLIYENIDEAKAHGIESELQWNWKNHLSGRFSYTYQDATDDSTGKTLSNSPDQIAQLQLRIPVLRDKLVVGLTTLFIDDRTTPQGTKASGYSVTNLTLSSQLLRNGLELTGTIYNLFDKDYAHPASEEHTQDVIAQDGAHWRVGIRYSF